MARSARSSESSRPSAARPAPDAPDERANEHLPAGHHQRQAAGAEQTGAKQTGAKDSRSSQGPRGKSGSATSRPPSKRVRELPPPPRVAQSAEPKPQVAPAPGDGPRWVRWWRHGGRREVVAFLTSLILHCGGLVVLALWQFSLGFGEPGASWVLDLDTGAELLDDVLIAEQFDPEELSLAETLRLAEQDMPIPEVPSVPETPDQFAQNQPQPILSSAQEPIDWLERRDADVRGSLSGRSAQARARLLGPRGGNQQSERAVARGLRWLMAHQREDGSWSFDLSGPFCHGQCRNPGTATSTTAATGLALLPFLGAGHTHLEGDYRETVRRGLYYLTTRALVTPHGVDLQDGTMYGQGLAAIALCEAYGMTKDRNLRDLAQQAIDFICFAQDSRGGGWRYTPGEPGDTTVTGWQLMALKSAQMAGLHVPTPNIALVHRFLNSVQSDDGAQYGYLTPQPRRTTTAIGLLCRMYTGWRFDHPGLRRGVALLSQWGRSDDNMYYNYYATQVMFHTGGSEWQRWNRKMRDYLIATQATQGHEAGSWHFSGGRGDVGGRLYNTAMAVMTLEVYYRYQPLYSHAAIEEGF